MGIFLWLILSVSILVWLSVRYHLHPFIGLLLAALFMGFIGGLPPGQLITTLTGGFGSTIGSIGIVIAAGAIIGEYLEKSGGASVLAGKILAVAGEKRAPLAMGVTGYIVSIPVFCDSGFIVLSALNRAIAGRTGISLSVLAVALGSGLYVTHVFVPPTPGPLAAAATLGADVGWVLMLGLLVSIPVLGVALLWATKACKAYMIKVEIPQDETSNKQEAPAFALALLPILTPILLIALKSIAELPAAPFGESAVFSVITFIGEPIISLLIGAALSLLLVRSGKKIRHQWLEAALQKAGLIILITGAGGAFGAILRQTSLADFAAGFTDLSSVSLLLPFLIAAFLKTAQGSSTVAIITTSALMAPLLTPMGLDDTLARALVVLVIGAGAMTISHINDSYFWVVARFSAMDTATALKTHTVASLLMGITALITLQLLALFLI